MNISSAQCTAIGAGVSGTTGASVSSTVMVWSSTDPEKYFIVVRSTNSKSIPDPITEKLITIISQGVYTENIISTNLMSQESYKNLIINS